MQELLNKVIKECYPVIQEGEVASYIPELKNANKNEFGICVIGNDGSQFVAGDYNKTFSLQSIIKPLILLMALMDHGEEKVRSLVGVESTGKPFDTFNYSDQALNCEHINPMVNTGAIALCSLIKGKGYQEKFERLLALTRKLTGNNDLAMDEKLYRSEKETGSKNRALAYMLKAYGMLHGDVEEVLDFYFSGCSIMATTVELARMGRVFANGGYCVETKEQLFKKEYARYINAVLITCGMYDGSGNFAINVGVPAKSGVGGGIMAIVPHRMGIGIYSPALNKKGNSVAGLKALEMLSKNLDLSIFD